MAISLVCNPDTLSDPSRNMGDTTWYSIEISDSRGHVTRRTCTFLETALMSAMIGHDVTAKYLLLSEVIISLASFPVKECEHEKKAVKALAISAGKVCESWKGKQVEQ
jgi:hypothetical protein